MPPSQNTHTHTHKQLPGTFGIFQKKSQIIADHRRLSAIINLRWGYFGKFWPDQEIILAIFGTKFIHLVIFQHLTFRHSKIEDLLWQAII
jgi:hypothetical protein